MLEITEPEGECIMELSTTTACQVNRMELIQYNMKGLV